MKFNKKIAAVSLAFSLIASAAIAAESPTPSAATPVTVAPAAAPKTTAKLEPVKKRFLLTHSSSVYSKPDKSSTVLAHVHGKSHVNVTGVVGDWLRIRMSNGKEGYIPSSAAE